MLYQKAGKMTMAEWVENLAVYGDGTIARRFTAARDHRVPSPQFSGLPSGNVDQGLCFT